MYATFKRRNATHAPERMSSRRRGGGAGRQASSEVAAEESGVGGALPEVEQQEEYGSRSFEPQLDVDLEDLEGVGRVTAQKLREAGFFTIKDIAFASSHELAAVLGSEERALSIIQAAQKMLMRGKLFMTAKEYYEERKNIAYISTGVKALDDLLEGGIETRAITELIGEFGAGKTQLCHQLAVMVQLPREKGGLSGKALYIDTEGTFRPERIVSMARYRGLDPEEALEGVLVVEAPGQAELAEAVLALGGLGVQLVVVDSISYPFAFPRSVGEARRSWGRMAALLKRLALWGGLAVVASAERGGRVVGDPYASMWVDRRVRLEPLGGGLVEARLAVPWSPRGCRLRIAEEGVLPAGSGVEGAGGDRPGER